MPDFAPDAFVLGVFEAFAGFDVFTFEVEVFDLLADFAVEVLADEAEERRATLLFDTGISGADLLPEDREALEQGLYLDSIWDVYHFLESCTS